MTRQESSSIIKSRDSNPLNKRINNFTTLFLLEALIQALFELQNRGGFFWRNSMPVKKKVPARVQYKDYADYLKSDKWASVKQDYRDHEQTEVCLCCGDDFKDEGLIINYHHFKYPKDWNNDSWENLIVVCEGCHTNIHDSYDHGSNQSSIRDYMLRMIWLNNQSAPSVLNFISKKEYQKDLWNAAEGRFSIEQVGISPRKTMKADLFIIDQDIINFFVDARDKAIEKDSE